MSDRPKSTLRSFALMEKAFVSVIPASAMASRALPMT